MKTKWTLVLATLLLAACDQLSPPSHQRYQLVSSPDGRVYRLNAASGDVFLVKDNELIAISADSDIQLRIGQTYKFEDARRMKYLGTGKFESAPKIIWKDTQAK